MPQSIHRCLKPLVFQLLRTRMANANASPVGSCVDSRTIQNQKQTLQVPCCSYVFPHWNVAQTMYLFIYFTNQGFFSGCLILSTWICSVAIDARCGWEDLQRAPGGGVQVWQPSDWNGPLGHRVSGLSAREGGRRACHVHWPSQSQQICLVIG